MLSKLTKQSVGTPSAWAESSNSETRPRRVRVRAATTTLAIRPATGSRVRTSTGRSPPGVAANHTSPLCIGPVRPVFGRPPVGDGRKRQLSLIEGVPLPDVGLDFAGQTEEVSADSVAEDLRAIHAQPVGPCLHLGGDGLIQAEAEHCHTSMLSCMTWEDSGILLWAGKVVNDNQSTSWRYTASYQA